MRVQVTDGAMTVYQEWTITVSRPYEISLASALAELAQLEEEFCAERAEIGWVMNERLRDLIESQTDMARMEHDLGNARLERDKSGSKISQIIAIIGT